MQALLDQMLQVVAAYIPRLAGTLILLVAAWIVANVLRGVTRRALAAAHIDQRLGRQDGAPMSQTLSDIVYGLTWLFFLPGILDALGMQGLLVPVQGMVNRVLNFLPNILAAGIILLIGTMVARLVRQIVSNLLVAVGADRLSERVGLKATLGTQGLSGLLGLIVYIFILFPVLISALDALAIDVVTRPAIEMLNKVFTAIPSILAAIVTLIIAVLIGRVVSGLIANLLAGMGFNALPARLGLKAPPEGSRMPSDWVGSLIFAAIVYLAAVEASRLLGFTLVSELAAQFTVFAAQVFGGLLIFMLGLYLSNLAASAIAESGAAQANALALVARLAILVLVGAMGLRAMGMANEIINLAFGLLLGAIAVASALAFGLGGREVAARMLDEWSQSLRKRD